ncbi:MAG TPA: adenylate/guanylate cyclase domain-containing protein [Allosphingosinicella sp.]|nr:adenylate/guanylate cyclase domain-containing protein [Allosphingosinicella sp.]
MSEAGSGPAPAAPPRRRQLAILFSDLSESTRIAGRLDPEDYAELLARLRQEYHRAVEAHGGAVAQISGDGMLAIFGHPEAREDDGRRAVEAALALHAAVEAMAGGPFRLHSGVHSGLVLLHEGDTVRGRFEVTGNATNIAAKLCGLAEAGQILVSEATLGPERHLFETSERSRLTLGGKEEPVTVLAVHGAVAGRRFTSSVRGGLTPFIGRGRELAGLGHALGDMLAGNARFVEIEGPAGVGKTRLAEEVIGRALARGATVHRGECDPAAAPLQPILQILRSLLGNDDALPAGAAGWRAAVEEAGRQGPLLLFLDDWHLADDASREMLGVLHDLERLPLLVLATSRPGEGRISAFDVLPLAPFDADETREAVTRLLAAPDPFVIGKVLHSSGGNALFIEELCHSIADGRMGDGTPWLAALIEARLSRLPAAEAALVRQAAVIGTLVPAWLLEAITGHGEADPLVSALARQDFIFPGEREGMLRFKHGITREAVYESVRLKERRVLHGRIAEALLGRARETGEEEPHEALAYHYGAGEDWPATARHAELAGDKAAAVSALDRAQAQYRAALAALDRLPPSNEIAYRWGRIAQRFGRSGVFDPARDQIPVFDRAVELAAGRGDEAAMAWARYWLGYIYYGLGEPDTAIRRWQQALADAALVNDQRLISETRVALGQGHAAACDYEQALPLLDEAIEAKRAHLSPERPPIIFAYSLSCKGFALGDMGRFDEAHACFAEAMAAIKGARHEGEVSVLNQYAVVHLWQGRPEEAVALAQAGAAVAERVHSLYSHAMSRSIIAYAQWVIAPDPERADALLETTKWLEASGRGQFTSLNHGWLSQVMVASGRIAEGRAYAARALNRARKHDRLGEAVALRAMAQASAALGWRKPAVHYLALAYAAGRARKAPHEEAATRLCEAEIAAACGDAAAADAARAEAMRGYAALGIQLAASPAAILARPVPPSTR